MRDLKSFGKEVLVIGGDGDKDVFIIIEKNIRFFLKLDLTSMLWPCAVNLYAHACIRPLAIGSIN